MPDRRCPLIEQPRRHHTFGGLSMLDDQITQHGFPMWMLDARYMQSFGIGTGNKAVLRIINKSHAAGHASPKILPHFA